MKSLIFISLCGLLFSCRPAKELVRTETVTQIEYRDTVLPGETIFDTITNEVIKQIPVNRVIVKKDTTGRAELRYWKDEAGRLRIECEAKDRKATIANTTTATKREEVKIIYRTPNWVRVALVVAALIAIFSIVNPFKK